MKNALKKIISVLSKRETTNKVFNPYEDRRIANNLDIYFNFLYQRYPKTILIIGEAPGYKGCKITGIPFTSGSCIMNLDIGIFNTIRKDIYLPSVETEKTATIIWEYLSQKHILPVFWNAFPFHPHKINENSSNRAPSSEEIKEGRFYIKNLMDLFVPDEIIALGRKGEIALKNITDATVKYIRHPSHGGKSDFIKGMNQIIK